MITIFSFTQNGAVLGEKIRSKLKQTGQNAETLAKYPLPGGDPLTQSISETVSRLFFVRQALVFVGAVGIAVRAIAPSIAGKERDPAVLVVDDTGTFVIPILSGHIGGANGLALEIAHLLSATPVLTTATDRNGCFAVDTWAVREQLTIPEPGKIKLISAALLRGESVSLHCEFPIETELPEGISLSDKGEIGIFIGEKPCPEFYPATLQLFPRLYAVGIGCRRGIDFSTVEGQLLRVLTKAGVARQELFCIASVNLKEKEEALVRLAEKWRIPFLTYSAEELGGISGSFTPSEFVRSVTGVDNVCERAATAAAQASGYTIGEPLSAASPVKKEELLNEEEPLYKFPPELVLPKQAENGVTIALARRNWRCRF